MADGAYGLDPPDGAEPDEVEASRAPLLSHLTELRRRLIVMIGALGVGFVLAFAASYVLLNILIIPFVDATTKAFGEASVINYYPLELFFTRVKIGVVGGLMLAFPVIAQQTYAFVAPGLYKRERAAVLPFLLAMPVLFGFAILIVHQFILPLIMEFAVGMQGQAEAGGTARYNLFVRAGDYLNLALTLMIGFGFAFQLPVVLSLLGRAGIVTPELLAKNRPFAICGIFAVCMFLTPPDPISLIGLGVIVCVLYEASIWTVRWGGGGQAS